MDKKQIEEMIEYAKKASKCIYLACDESVARDIHDVIWRLLNRIETLQKRCDVLGNAMTGICELCKHFGDKIESEPCRTCLDRGFRSDWKFDLERFSKG